MTCESTSLEIIRKGFSWARLLEVRNASDNTLQDLSAATISVEFRSAPGLAPFTTLTIGSGVTLLVTTGYADIHATPLVTAAWPTGNVYYSIAVQAVPLGTKDEVETGAFLVKP